MSLITAIRQSVFDIFRLTYYFRIFYIRNRAELPLILNRQRLTGKGVEVGVWKADFSNFLLEKWQGKKLYVIDPWKNFEPGVYVDDMNITQQEFEIIFNEVQKKLTVFGEKAVIIRDLSVNAARSFDDGSLDFVYLDARHDYAGVKEDIVAWYPKVKTGGLLCGHDYLDTTINSTVFGVKTAVDEFARQIGSKPVITAKDDYPSWFMYKKARH